MGAREIVEAIEPVKGTKVEFKIWDDLSDAVAKGPGLPKRFDVYGWTAEVHGGPFDDGGRIVRIRFSKEGFRPMDMAVTGQLLADATPNELANMFAQRVQAHEVEQRLLYAPTPTKNFKEEKHQDSTPPPSPSGAVLRQDLEPDLYTAIISPEVKRALMEDLHFPAKWIKDPVPAGPEADAKGDWSI